jgi:hypothetical protein
VRKRGGEEYPGLIVSIFTNRTGAVCYVVEVYPPFSGTVSYFRGGAVGIAQLTGVRSLPKTVGYSARPGIGADRFLGSLFVTAAAADLNARSGAPHRPSPRSPHHESSLLR